MINQDLIIEWPDYGAKPVDERDAALIDDTIRILEARNPTGELAEMLRRKPVWAHRSAFGFAPWPEANLDNTFDEDGAEVFVEVIITDLGRRHRREKAAGAIEAAFAGPDDSIRRKLREKLGRDREGSRRRTTYDRIILSLLFELAKAVRFDWDDGKVRFGNMPTPNEVVVEYYLRLQRWPGHDLERAREHILRELDKFSSRPRPI